LYKLKILEHGSKVQ